MTYDDWKTRNPADENLGNAKQGVWRCGECGCVVYAYETHYPEVCRSRRIAIAEARARLEKSMEHARGRKKR